MFGYVLMKLFESSPRRYDKGISFLTFNRINKIRKTIVENYISPNDTVLDIGCGTGTLSLLCAQKANRVTGIDLSPEMLKIAERRKAQNELINNIEFLNMNAVEIEDRFRAKQFDKIVSTLVLSDLSDNERELTLKECAEVMKDGGLICLADEVAPRNQIGRFLFYLFRFPFALITGLLTQATTKAVKDLEGDIKKAGLRITNTHNFLLGTLRLIVASKE